MLVVKVSNSLMLLVVHFVILSERTARLGKFELVLARCRLATLEVRILVHDLSLVLESATLGGANVLDRRTQLTGSIILLPRLADGCV